MNLCFSQNSKWQTIDSVRYYHNSSPYMSAYFFKAIDCFDVNNCVAIGNLYGSYPWNRVTTNGGLTWETTLRDTFKFDTKDSVWYFPAPASAIAYPSKNLCIIACDSGYFWRSTDNCQTWRKGKVNVKSKYTLKKICFYNDKKGAVIDDEELFLTTNGGIDWEKAIINYPDSIKPISVDEVSIINENLIYVILQCYVYDEIAKKLIFKYTRFYFSTDFGKNWDFYEPDMYRPYKVKFINEKTGWALAIRLADSTNLFYSHVIYRTDDGGKSWFKQLDSVSFPNPIWLISIHFTDSLNGLALGYWYKLWRTTDGGRHWNLDNEYFKRATKGYLIDIFLLNPDSFFGVVADDNAYIYKYDNSTSVDEYIFRKEGEWLLQIIPNPAEEFIEISNINPTLQRGVARNTDIRIFNVFGEVVSTPKNLTPDPSPNSRGEVRIDVSGLPSGVYFVRVGDKVGKLVKI